MKWRGPPEGSEKTSGMFFCVYFVISYVDELFSKLENIDEGKVIDDIQDMINDLPKDRRH